MCFKPNSECICHNCKNSYENGECSFDDLISCEETYKHDVCPITICDLFEEKGTHPLL